MMNRTSKFQFHKFCIHFFKYVLLILSADLYIFTVHLLIIHLRNLIIYIAFWEEDLL